MIKNPQNNPDSHQNLTTFFLGHDSRKRWRDFGDNLTILYEMSSKSFRNFCVVLHPLKQYRLPALIDLNQRKNKRINAVT